MTLGECSPLLKNLSLAGRFMTMSDERLRELERHWKETGAVEDHAAYLLERLRVGDLEQEKLELAAYCGHEGAVAALGTQAPEVPTDFRLWVLGLLAQGYPTSAHVCVAVARLALDQGKGLAARDALEKLRQAEDDLLVPERDRVEEVRALDFGPASDQDYEFRVPALFAWRARAFRFRDRVPTPLGVALYRLGEAESRGRVAETLIAWALSPTD